MNENKFIESFIVDEWEIETPSGYQDIIASHKTVEYKVFEILLDNGLTLKGADDHILINADNKEVFLKDSLYETIKTKQGNAKVIALYENEYEENMYDLQLDHLVTDKVYYTNDILSHNTTVTMAYLLWKILFNDDYGIAIVANKADSAQEVLFRLQTAYEELPYWLQQGVVEWNKRSVLLENRSKIFTGATTASGIRGKSVNCVTGNTKVKIRIDGVQYESDIDKVNDLIYEKTGNYPKAKYVSKDKPNLIVEAQ